MLKSSCRLQKAIKMKFSPASKIGVASLILFLMGCDAEKKPQAKETQSNTVSKTADMKAKSSTALDKKSKDVPSTPAEKTSTPPKKDDKTVNDAEELKKKEATKKELDAKNALLPPKDKKDANPLLNNAVLKSTFTAYMNTGINDASFDALVLNDKLTADVLTPEEQKGVFEKYIRVIETPAPSAGEDVKDTDLSKTVPVATRMKDVFDFYKNNEIFAQVLSDKIKNESVTKILSDDEKKFATPFIYLSIIFGQALKSGDEFYGFNVSETTHADNKKFHTMILGKVEWYKGSKKKVLTKNDQANLDFIRDMTNAWMSSDFKPTAETTLKVVGNAEKDKNESANKIASEKRAQMVYDYMTKANPPFQGTYQVVGVGSDAILKANPKDVKNRRIEIVISETEEAGAPAGDNEAK